MMGSALKCFVGVSLLLFILGFHSIDADARRSNFDGIIQSPTITNLPTLSEDDNVNIGTRWAILVAGSAGYPNYRHQADVCHAYQILRRGGLKEENIVVFMYDDIAYSPGNPHTGVIINNPQGGDVYGGVPKDYTGKNVSVNNFFAALLGEKASLQGGSGKVVDSGPNDHIFIYYADHGGPGVLGMPNRPNLYADDFIEVLKKKYAAGTYKQMVIYVEACESGSIFEGLLPEGMNIYVTTASNAEESSWGTYCPGMSPPPPPEYDVCLGDLYSVAWMEDSEVHDLEEETLMQQYLLVKDRTSNHNTYEMGSHVMQYGDIPISKEPLSLYIGFDPANANVTSPSENDLPQIFQENYSKAINQRDADLLYLWQKYKRSKDDSPEKLDTQKEIVELMTHRMHVDRSINIIGELLFGSEMGPAVLKGVRPRGQPLVDDWDCLKTLVRTFESHCGSLSQYGLKHMRAIANICNKGVTVDSMAAVSAEACTQIPSGLWSSIQTGYSA